MKFVKGISLFFIYPLIMFGLGIYTGIAFEDFFYPGRNAGANQIQESQIPVQIAETRGQTGLGEGTSEEETGEDDAVETILKEDVLTADTEYVLEEVDIKKGTSVETVWKVPEKYIGMNRDRFVKAMDEYSLSPPLSELERGFIGLEVMSFSAKKVQIRMNYDYVEPSENFYLGVQNNYVVVYLDDRETVYIETDILLESLPDNIQQQIIQYMFIEDEEALYNFLESYSS